jgi:hypothetical protein
MKYEYAMWEYYTAMKMGKGWAWRSTFVLQLLGRLRQEDHLNLGVQVQLWQHFKTPQLKKEKKAGGVAKVIEHLLCKCKVLS